MVIYFIIYLIFFAFTLGDLFLSRESKRPLLVPLILLGIMMIIFAGLRWETGTDWPNYLRYFRIIDKLELGKTQMEKGYELIVRIYKFTFGSNYTGFLFFNATILILITYLSVYRSSPYPIFSLFLLLSYSVVGSSFGVRQDLSICLILFSFTFIRDRALVKFIICVFLATLIHNSAVIFFPAYYLYNLKWNVLTAIFFLLVVASGFYWSSSIMQIFGGMISERKAEFYLELGMDNAEESGTSLVKGLAGRILFLVTLIPFVNYSENGDKVFNGLFNLYVFSIILYAIFTPVGAVFSRLARPYEIFQILAIPFAYYGTNRFYKVALLVIIFTFSIYKFSSAIRNDPGILVPYKTIFTA
ncbi:EpsG family protein [Dyadobacter luticola]|uniref:EpsG family protein n=1 Tax=Dyadobacter luticola TaxID=1979387 RepID=A0A5R9KWZ2_9BACT|nr:EpsG family protein [Dyadobacter luticola]TLV00783.1 EpsG family protein [Dyadobacter luticola]